MQLFSFLMRGWISPADVFVTLYAADENSFWLDREHHQNQRYSVLGHSYQDVVLDTPQAFQALLERSEWAQSEPELPFQYRPGFVGSFDYSAEPTHQPAGVWLDVREAFVFDHDAKRIYLIGYFESEPAFSEWVQAALLRLSLSGGQSAGYRFRNATLAKSTPVGILHTETEYLDLIERVQQHIRLGDVYQVCLTNQIQLQHKLDPLETFMRLRESNPAPYAAYLKTGHRVLVSSSPEQFLNLDSSGMLTTRPIKGTRPRSKDDAEDAMIASELFNDEKERAENLMIVDLMRNDLARVAEVDSVAVSELFAVESYATVHQLVSSITAQLRVDSNAFAALASAFPAGSMTGAPKMRAMQIAAELEGAERGRYSGVLGYLGLDGSFDFGMVIRTLVFEGEQLSIGVGGGITIDSDPVAEVEETKLKAAALLAAANATDPWQVAW